jgi:hypothetical protein
VRTRRIETVLLGIGVTLLAIWGGARIHSTVSSHAAVKSFEVDQVRSHPNSEVTSGSVSGYQVDFALWSWKRVEAYKDSLGKKKDRPLAILRIPKIHLEVPVYDNTDV